MKRITDHCGELMHWEGRLAAHALRLHGGQGCAAVKLESRPIDCHPVVGSL